MPVTIRIIKTARLSTRNVSGTLRSPDEIHVKIVCSTGAWCEITDQAVAADTANEPSMTATASPPLMDFDSRLPTHALITKPMNGRSGISSSIESTHAFRIPHSACHHFSEV